MNTTKYRLMKGNYFEGDANTIQELVEHIKSITKSNKIGKEWKIIDNITNEEIKL